VRQVVLTVGTADEIGSVMTRQNGPVQRWPSPMKRVNEPNGFAALGTIVGVEAGPRFGRRTECERVE
jgi:hypothetical protein